MGLLGGYLRRYNESAPARGWKPMSQGEYNEAVKGYLALMCRVLRQRGKVVENWIQKESVDAIAYRKQLSRGSLSVEEIEDLKSLVGKCIGNQIELAEIAKKMVELHNFLGKAVKDLSILETPTPKAVEALREGASLVKEQLQQPNRRGNTPETAGVLSSHPGNKPRGLVQELAVLDPKIGEQAHYYWEGQRAIEWAKYLCFEMEKQLPRASVNDGRCQEQR